MRGRYPEWSICAWIRITARRRWRSIGPGPKFFVEGPSVPETIRSRSAVDRRRKRTETSSRSRRRPHRETAMKPPCRSPCSNILSPKWLTQVIKPERDLPWIRFAHPARLPYSSTPILQRHFRRLRRSRFLMAEGARFELAVHEVDAGFQDRWFQPLTHPSGMMVLARKYWLSNLMRQ